MGKKNRECIDCGGIVSRNETKRCRKCYSKRISYLLKGVKKSDEHKKKIKRS